MSERRVVRDPRIVQSLAFVDKALKRTLTIDDIEEAIKDPNVDINQKDEIGRNPLLHCAWNNDIPACRVLLENGAVMRTDHVNANKVHDAICTAMSKGKSHIETTMFLIEQCPAKLFSATNEHKQTYLHIAIELKLLEVAQCIRRHMTKKATLSKDSEKRTCLESARLYWRNDPTLLAALEELNLAERPASTSKRAREDGGAASGVAKKAKNGSDAGGGGGSAQQQPNTQASVGTPANTGGGSSAGDVPQGGGSGDVAAGRATAAVGQVKPAASLAPTVPHAPTGAGVGEARVKSEVTQNRPGNAAASSVDRMGAGGSSHGGGSHQEQAVATSPTVICLDSDSETETAPVLAIKEAGLTPPPRKRLNGKEREEPHHAMQCSEGGGGASCSTGASVGVGSATTPVASGLEARRASFRLTAATEELDACRKELDRCKIEVEESSAAKTSATYTIETFEDELKRLSDNVSAKAQDMLAAEQAKHAHKVVLAKKLHAMAVDDLSRYEAEATLAKDGLEYAEKRHAKALKKLRMAEQEVKGAELEKEAAEMVKSAAK